MYKGCIFDLDGTLANTLNSIAYFGNTALAGLGLCPIDTAEYRLMVGNGADMLIKRMLKKSGGGDELLVALRTAYDALYEGDPMHLVTPYVGIVPLVAKLRARGIRTAVLSNKPDNMTRATIAGLFPQGSFSHVQGQLPGVPHKPNPTAVLQILEKIKLPPAEILYIGDSGVDMETGRNAGLDTAGVLWGFRDRRELSECGASFLVETVPQLHDILFD